MSPPGRSFSPESSRYAGLDCCISSLRVIVVASKQRRVTPACVQTVPPMIDVADDTLVFDRKPFGLAFDVPASARKDWARVQRIPSRRIGRRTGSCERHTIEHTAFVSGSVGLDRRRPRVTRGSRCCFRSWLVPAAHNRSKREHHECNERD